MGWTQARLLLVCLAAAAVPPVLGGAASAAAPGSAVFSLLPSPDRTPAYFVFRARPGTRVTDRLQLANVGSARGVATLYAVDGTTGTSSGVVYLSRAEPRRDVGRWIRLPVHRVFLLPGETKTVKFTLTVPRRTWRGQHVGGIVAEAAPQISTTRTQSGRGFGVRIRHLVIVAAEVIVPGSQRFKLDIRTVGSRNWGRRQQLLLGLRNRGTTIVKPSGSVRVYTRGHDLVKRIQLRLDSFLPHTAINLPVFVPGRRLALGRYIVEVSLYYSPNRTTRFHGRFTVTR